MVASLIFMATFAPWLAPYDPAERVGLPFQPPSADHWLGTNDVGQDLLSELIFGARVSLTVGIVAAIVALILGTTVGVLAGYYPKRLGRILMQGVDVILVAKNLERVADHATNIAEDVILAAEARNVKHASKLAG